MFNPFRWTKRPDLITAGVAPMTIAKMAGTSVEQIEKTYHHPIDLAPEKRIPC